MFTLGSVPTRFKVTVGVALGRLMTTSSEEVGATPLLQLLAVSQEPLESVFQLLVVAVAPAGAKAATVAAARAAALTPVPARRSRRALRAVPAETIPIPARATRK